MIEVSLGNIRGIVLRRCLSLSPLLVCASVWAGPLALTASQSLTHDSNFARTESRQADTISATSLQLSLDKQYGRQTYFGSAKATAYRYKNNGDRLDNDSKDLSLGVASELGANWKVQLNGAYDQNLNQFENNLSSNRLVRNIRTLKSANGQVTYGLSGIWALVGSAGRSSLAYSESAYANQNTRQDVVGLKAVYFSSDLLNYSLGVRKVESKYTAIGEKIHENDLDLSTQWVVSGLSQLGATVSWTQSKRDIQSDRKFDGLTGNLNWSYTPRGLMSYGVSLYKTSNSDQFNQNYISGFDLSTGQFKVGTAQLAYNTKTTSANAFARWSATSKLSLTANATVNQYSFDQDTLSGPVSDSSLYKSLSLNAAYAFDRHFQLYGGVTSYKQSRDLTRNPYYGLSVNAAASFMLD